MLLLDVRLLQINRAFRAEGHRLRRASHLQRPLLFDQNPITCQHLPVTGQNIPERGRFRQSAQQPAGGHRLTDPGLRCMGNCQPFALMAGKSGNLHWQSRIGNSLRVVSNGRAAPSRWLRPRLVPLLLARVREILLPLGPSGRRVQRALAVAGHAEDRGTTDHDDVAGARDGRIGGIVGQPALPWPR